MAITYTDNGGGAPNGSDKEFTYSFPVIQTEDVKVALNGVTQATTKYTVDNVSNPTHIEFNNTSIDSSVQESSGAPKSGVRVRVYRETTVGKTNGDEDPKAVFAAGSSIRAVDLNANQEQALFAIHELQTRPIETEDVQNSAITSDKIADATIQEADIANSAVTSIKIADNNVTTTEILNGAVTRAKLEADIIDGTKLADNAVDSEHYTDGSIDRVHLAADAIDGTKLADDSIDSEHYVDGSIDTAHIADDAVIGSKIFNGAVTHTKLGTSAVTTAKIDNNAVTIDKIADSIIVTNSEQASHSVDDSSFFTTSAAEARYFNASTGETIKDGQTFPDNDTTIATTAAINDRIIDLVDDVGGFVPIANETSFPTANPDVNNGTGTIVSVSAASTNLVPSGTTVTITNGAGTGNNVTITGVSSTIPTGFGFLVETTTTLHTYTFHRLSPKATEVTTVAGKATEIGRLGTAAAVEDLSILGTADVVADLNTLGTADVVSDMNTLGTADVVADMNTLAVTSVINNMDTVAGAVTNVNNVGGSIANVNTTAGSIANVNTVAGSITNVNTVGGAISNVNTTAGSIANVNTVATNINDINDFSDKYRVGANNPTTGLDTGDLFFNTTSDSLKVYTGSAWVDGVTTTGDFALKTGNTFTGSNIHNDNVKSIYGTNSDLEIYGIASTGTAGIINHANGDLLIKHGADKQLISRDDGSVELYYDDSKKFYTTSTGAYIENRLDIGGANNGWSYPKALNVQSSSGAVVALRNWDTTTYAQDTNTSIDFSLRTGNTGNQAGSCEIRAFKENGTNGNNARGLAFYTGVNSGQPQKNLVINSGGNLDIPKDNAILQIGASQDLQLYHDGTDSEIKNNTGELKILANNVQFKTKLDDETLADFNANGACELYHNNIKRFETAGDGATIFGPSTTTALLKILGGESQSAEIRLVADEGDDTSDTLRLHQAINGSFFLQNLADGSFENMLVATPNGGVELYHNNVKKLETDSNGTIVTGHLYVSDELNMTTGGNKNRFIDGSCDDGEAIFIRTTNGGDANHEYMAAFYRGASAELYHNNSVRFATTSTGVSIPGILQMGTSSSYIDLPDNSSLYCGTGDDLRIFHNGTNSFISNTTGILQIDSDDRVQVNATEFRVKNAGDTETIAKFIQDGACELYHNNLKKLETTSNGANITGGLNISGGTINNTNDAVFYVDKTNNNDWAAKIKSNAGSSTDYGLRIECNSGSSFPLTVNSGSDVFRVSGAGAVYATEFHGDGSNLTGITSVGGSTGVAFNDNVNITLGTGNDTFIRHIAGSHTEIDHVGTGDLILETVNGGDDILLNSNDDVFIQHAGEDMAQFRNDGEVSLYYDNARKISTTSNGIEIPGNCAIELDSGNWTGEHAGKIQHHGNWLYLQGGSNGFKFRSGSGTNTWVIDSNGHLQPAANNTFDIGTTSYRVRNIYTNDLHLSNEGSSNDVDGSWGDWTIQEGESDLFLKNNRSGKKYKFNLTEVS